MPSAPDRAMNTDTLRFLRVLVAGYGFPAEFGITELFGSGIRPEAIKVLTHANDERNSGLHAIAKLRGCELKTNSPTDPETIKWVKDFQPDLVLSLHYRKRIPIEILNIAKYGCINLHPSLLPKYRGANSVAWAIINGESETGFTFHFMEEEFDTGEIILQEKIKISSYDTSFSLFHRQITTAMRKFPEVVNSVLYNSVWKPQKGGGSYYGRQLPHKGLINPEWPVEQIERFIRAMYFPPHKSAVLNLGNHDFEIESIEQYEILIEKQSSLQT